MQLKATIAALAGFWSLSVQATLSQPVDLRNLLSQESNSWANGTIISFPSTYTFNNATIRWSTFDAPTYYAAISPANEADVVNSVRVRSFRNEKEHFLTSCHRSSLHHSTKSHSSPPVRAMATLLP